ncbi:S-adenosyl-L-methionine-dependent methyltransferase [Dissoconium aciculare CBS 342.82]|uniref:S-adenosyl-L-methionine-dependent methyltransferase n=1 Tax=Dissoconium aciculare CBS 342.82 TaxID=1314786 RepID=A0A6J3M2C7_9PEZI|nr:S-adenosyl-L-methionine-dependent methyltransferase [Dissoconium aciculare CBS 342.82]KAF1822063.1 S-adenosyl-L-methionine-dependent methyltransferase [Dissoconium aciculare CBS 342.82]
MITPFLLGTALFNPHLSNMRLNNRLAAHDWLLVDRAWSTTGYISVLENHSAVYRVLRADHSLLGGEWLLTQERQTQQHWLVPEPTYAVFEMLEAVRLVRSPGGKSPVADGDASALVIGLGIGTAPKALISHRIDTTIVELDPAVHRFAKKWFALPGNHTAVIADAVEWVAGGQSIPDDDSKDDDGGTPLRRFDYIIHDVFTGGASPLSLFTAQFLRDLRARLREDGGVIAINYAGDLSLPLTGHVLGTIERVFDGRRNCRIFRDGPPPQKAPNSDRSEADFTNMVIFCLNTASDTSEFSSSAAAAAPPSWDFRTPVEADYLNTHSRRQYLVPKAEYEMPFPETTSEKVLEVGEEALWAEQQLESARRHWALMRQVVPGVVWDLW